MVLRGGVHLNPPTPSPPSEWHMLLGGLTPPQHVQQPLHVGYIVKIGVAGGAASPPPTRWRKLLGGRDPLPQEVLWA